MTSRPTRPNLQHYQRLSALKCTNSISLIYEILFFSADMILHIAVEKLKVMGRVLRNEVTIKFHLIIYMLGCEYSNWSANILEFYLLNFLL